jgi:hypothetical protein
MAQFEEGHLGDIRDFAYDLDSDEEPYDSDLDASDDSGWESEIPSDEDEESDEAQKAFDAFSKRFKDRLSLEPGSRRPHYIFDNFNDPSKPLDLSLIPTHMRKTDQDVMALMWLSLIKEKDYSDTSHATLEAEFLRHIDRKNRRVSQLGGPSISALSVRCPPHRANRCR